MAIAFALGVAHCQSMRSRIAKFGNDEYRSGRGVPFTNFGSALGLLSGPGNPVNHVQSPHATPAPRIDTATSRYSFGVGSGSYTVPEASAPVPTVRSLMRSRDASTRTVEAPAVLAVHESWTEATPATFAATGVPNAHEGGSGGLGSIPWFEPRNSGPDFPEFQMNASYTASCANFSSSPESTSTTGSVDALM